MRSRSVFIFLLMCTFAGLALADGPPAPSEGPESKAAENAERQSASPTEAGWANQLEVEFSATGVLQGATKSAAASSEQEKNPVDAPMLLGLELTVPASEAFDAFVSFEWGQGAGVDETMSSLSGFNAAAADEPYVHLNEVWVEQRWAGEAVRLHAGLCDLTSTFDTNALANSETDQFLSPGFVNSLGVEFPETGPAAVLMLSPAPRFDFQLALAEGDGDLGDVLQHSFQIGEVDFKPEPQGQAGNYRLYAWKNNMGHEQLKTGEMENGYGVGVSCDQSLGGGLTAFGRYAWEKGSVYQADRVWSGGLELSHRFFGTREQRFGLAYGVAEIGADWVYQSKTEGIESDAERHLELVLTTPVNDHLSLAPDLQWITNRDGEAGNASAYVVGLRTQLSF